MAVAKERTPANRTLERVPHPKIAYAFLDIEVSGTFDEFLAYREEVLSKHPLYGTSPLEKTVAAPVGDEASNSGDETGEPSAEVSPAPAPAEAAAPTSARDIARAKILAKRAEGSK